MSLTLLQIIEAKYDDFTTVQKCIARYILDNLSECAFATVDEIAQASGVSKASVVRFAKEIGFPGFPGMKLKIQEDFRQSVTVATKLNKRLEHFTSSTSVLGELLKTEVEQANVLITEQLVKDYAECVKLIANSKELILYGEGASASLTHLLEFRFRRFKYHITRINYSGKYFFDSTLSLPSNAVAIICGLGRPPEERLFFLKRAKKLNNKTILITDSNISGLTANADYILPVGGRSLGMFHSLVMPTLIVEALVLGVAVERKEDVIQSLNELEELRKTYGYPKIVGFNWYNEIEEKWG